MNNDIKEILDRLKDGNWYNTKDLTGTEWIELTWEETHLLLNYITNLKQEKQEMKNGWQQEVYNKDEILNRWYETQGRIDKAIEYIHNHQPVFELSNKEQIQEWFEKEYYVELLNILQGDDVSENKSNK